jgi:outer membrane biosynthesis protein TonB
VSARAARYPAPDVALAVVVAIVVHFGALVLLMNAEPAPVVADLTDERAKPVSVAITPMIDEPVLQAGGKRAALPDMWQKPQPKAAAPKKDDGPLPSISADPNQASTAKVNPDAGPPSDATVGEQTAGDAASDPNATGDGSPLGSEVGSGDQRLALLITEYRNTLASWFLARFHIRGKIPFDKLKTLRATVKVDVSPDRRVIGYDVFPGSGDETFDDQVYRDMASIQASGATLPPPPDDHPEILRSPLRIVFQCTNRSSCE